MRVLLSTTGSRGDVEPLVGVALRIRELGGDVRLCVPPDFREWIEGLGIPVTTVGPTVRPRAMPMKPANVTPLARRRRIESTVAVQFERISEAAAGCDVLVGGGALQIAASSVAEMLGISYVHVHYCPISVPSPHHAPPPVAWGMDRTAGFEQQWAEDARLWNEHWGPALNERRKAAGLTAIEDVRSHVFTDRPWLAADATLGPWPEPEDAAVTQTGAWIRPAGNPLPPELEDFLEAGDSPVYFGLGSTPTADRDLGNAMVAAARTVGRRAVVARGWADLPIRDAGRDCLVIGEVNHQTLFPRVAAVVHHGGAGTTTAAARAGVPQVVIPQRYDQDYWAGRVAALGVGAAHPVRRPTVESLTEALEVALRSGTAARELGPRIRTDGVSIAAERLLA